MLSGSGSISMISNANLMRNGSKTLAGQETASLILHSTGGIFGSSFDLDSVQIFVCVRN